MTTSTKNTVGIMFASSKKVVEELQKEGLSLSAISRKYGINGDGTVGVKRSNITSVR
jgi:hypothetical protein